jgi:glutamate synthase (NADPH/NADH) large chain
MSLVSFIGPRPNMLDLEGRLARKRLEVRQPILTNEDLEKIRSIGDMETTRSTPRRSTSPIRRAKGAEGMEAALDGCASAPKRPCAGLQHHHPVRPHGRAGPHRDPSLLATAAVHHHLIRKGCAPRSASSSNRRAARGASLLRLAGYGAEAINPYLAFETLLDMQARRDSPRRSTSTRSSSATSRRSARAS